MTKTLSPGRPGFLLLCLMAVANAATAGTLFLQPAMGGHDPISGDPTNIPGITAISTIDGSYYNFAASPPGALTGMAVDTNGYLYVSYGPANVIVRYSPSGQSLFTSADTNGPGPLAFDAAGNLYSANSNNTLSIISTSGAVSNYAILRAAATALAIDSSRNVFALSGNDIYVVSNHTVKVFIDLGNYSTNPSAGYYYFNGPDNLAMDSHGNLFVATVGVNNTDGASTNEMGEISPAGVFSISAVYGNSGRGSPPVAGPAIDAAGDLYLSISKGFSGTSGTYDQTVVFPAGGGLQSVSPVVFGQTTGLVGTGFLAYSPSDNEISDHPVIPVITTQPQSQTVVYGTNITLSVVAVGGPLWYQWYFNDTNSDNPTNAISGATNSTITLNNVQAAQSGVYTVLVTNLVGATNSQPAQLDVLPGLQVYAAPAILLQGGVGLTYELQYISVVGPTNGWQTLATITLTNTSQFYTDYSQIGQPSRFYRLMQVP